MSSDVSCFDKIIGLSRTPCSDYSLSTDYTTSDSGLYLDELIPLSKAESLLNCKVGESVFPFLEKARSNAIMDFRMEATALLAERADITLRPFKGRIGKVKRSKALTSLTSGNYYGIVLRCDDIVGGEIKITDIATMFDTTGTIDVIVKNNLNTTTGTYTLNTTANTLENNTVSITLDTHSEYVENLEYYFIFQYNGTDSPYDNEFYNQDASWSKVYPTKTNKQFGYTDYLSPSGINLSSISDLSDVTVVTESRCFGLSLGIEARCKVEKIWCYDEMDYVGDPIDIAVAKAVRLKAASNLIRDIALSENLNRDTMIDGATLGEMDETWIAEYSDTLDFIVKNIDISRIDCFECGKQMLMGVGKIQS